MAGRGIHHAADRLCLLSVEVELEAIKFGEPFLLSSHLVAADGSEYQRELLGRTPDVVSLPEMSPGDRERAYFTFQIPAGSLHGLVLVYQLGFAGPEIEFALD
jgi:hypothetical protein